MNKIGIEWCALDGEASQKVTPDIVPGDEPARSATAVEAGQFGSATAGALDQWIRFTGQSAANVLGPMMDAMMRYGSHYLKVFRAIIYPIAVSVVDDLSLAEPSTQHLPSDQTVLIDITPHVAIGVFGSPNQNVAVRGNGSAALPPRVLRADLRANLSHAQIVARGVLHRKGVMPYA